MVSERWKTGKREKKIMPRLSLLNNEANIYVRSSSWLHLSSLVRNISIQNPYPRHAASPFALLLQHHPLLHHKPARISQASLLSLSIWFSSRRSSLLRSSCFSDPVFLHLRRSTTRSSLLPPFFIYIFLCDDYQWNEKCWPRRRSCPCSKNCHSSFELKDFPSCSQSVFFIWDLVEKGLGSWNCKKNLLLRKLTNSHNGLLIIVLFWAGYSTLWKNKFIIYLCSMTQLLFWWRP